MTNIVKDIYEGFLHRDKNYELSTDSLKYILNYTILELKFLYALHTVFAVLLLTIKSNGLNCTIRRLTNENRTHVLQYSLLPERQAVQNLR